MREWEELIAGKNIFVDPWIFEFLCFRPDEHSGPWRTDRNGEKWLFLCVGKQ